MCGIAGVLNLDSEPAAGEVVRSMTAALAHRGPDGEGVLADGPAGLGHRRLAILDLSPAAAQPMTTGDRRLALTYNGELYNFRELRDELESLGERFTSRSDTEVVLRAYSRWGESCLRRFNGMFAFAVWDAAKGRLFLARDRYGIKPLYYTLTGRRFLFASEIKAFLAHPDFSAAIDHEGLLEYLTFQNFFTSRTLFKDVHILPAGCSLRIEPESPFLPQPRRYWDFAFRDGPEDDGGGPADDREYVEELDRLFRQAVRRHLVSDVEIGSYLSGGMDSGAITAIAAGELPYVKTFTCGFDLTSVSGLEISFDERGQAERMSYRFRTEQYEMVLKAGDMERILPELTWHLEEPRVGQSYPNFYVARLASRFVKVVLSGAGGDELFAGYPWRYYRAVGSDDFDGYARKYHAFWQRLIPNGRIRDVFRPIWNDVKDVSTYEIFRDVFREVCGEGTGSRLGRVLRPEDAINHSLAFEARTFLHGLLVVEDKLSMAHGLETRVPFLDNDLVDFAMQVPVRLKLANLHEVVRINENEPGKSAKHFRKTRDGKLLLRRMMRRHVPGDIAEGIKQGFSAPDATWFRGESIDYVKERILRRKARIYDLLDRDTVHDLVLDHLEGRENRRLLIWSLLQLEEFCRRFV